MSDLNVSGAVAEWAHGLGYSDVPPRVVEEAKNQILSVIAGMHAGHFSEAGRMISRTVKEWSGGKDCTLIPSGEKSSLHSAIFGNSALAMTLLYDDYMLGAHTGASSVVVALCLAEKLGSSGKQILLAQIVANEVASRLGLSSMSDDLSEYRTPASHRLGAALAAAKLLELDQQQTYSAIGLAMQEAGVGVRAGFVGSDAKMLGAALAAPAGVQAAELAAGGLVAQGDPIGAEDGYCATVGSISGADAFRTLGELWLTETTSYAAYPCSSYVAGAIDCVMALQRQHNIDGRKVTSVEVTVGPAARDVDAMAQSFLAGPDSHPGALTFSIGYNVAVALIDKEFSPRQLSRDRVRDEAVWELAKRVEVKVEPASESDLRTGSLPNQVARGSHGGFDVGRIDLRAARAGLAAKVRVVLKNDRSFEIQRDTPSGMGSGPFDDRVKTVEDKFRRETRYSLRKERMEKAIDLIHHLERATPANVKEIVRCSCSER